MGKSREWKERLFEFVNGLKVKRAFSSDDDKNHFRHREICSSLCMSVCVFQSCIHFNYGEQLFAFQSITRGGMKVSSDMRR